MRKEIHNIGKHLALWAEIRQKALKMTEDGPTDEKIVLLKTHLDKSVNRPVTQVICRWLLKKLNQHGWVHLRPENEPIIGLLGRLARAKIIAFGHGAVLYTHMHAFNPQATWVYLNLGHKLKGYYQFAADGVDITVPIVRDLDAPGSNEAKVVINTLLKIDGEC